MGFRTPWGLPRSVSSPLLLPWLGSLRRSYAPIDGLVIQLRRQSGSVIEGYDLWISASNADGVLLA